MTSACQSCGGPVPSGAAFCPACGSALNTAVGFQQPRQQVSPQPIVMNRSGPGCLAWIGGCAVLVVIGFVGLVIIGAALGGHDTVSRISNGAHPAQPHHVAGAVTLLNVRGSGTKTTETFTVGDEWDLLWSYNCSGFAGGSGNFIVDIQRKGGGFGTPVGVNQLGSGGDSTEHYHDGGTYYLEINSECSWAVKVVDRS